MQQTPVQTQIPANETLDLHVEKVDKDRLNIDTPHVPILDRLEQTAQETETIAKEPDEMQNDPASGTVAPTSTGEDLTPVDKNLQVLADSLPQQDVAQTDPLGLLDDFAAGIRRRRADLDNNSRVWSWRMGIGALEDVYKVPELPPKRIQAHGDATALLQHQTAEQRQTANVDATLFGQRQESDPVPLPTGLNIDRAAQEAERRARLGRSAVNIANPGTIAPLGKKATQAEVARQRRLAQSPQNVADPGTIQQLPTKDLQREAARLQRLGDAPVNIADPGTIKPLSQKDLRREIERNQRLGIGLPKLFRKKKKGKPKVDIKEIAKAAAQRKKYCSPRNRRASFCATTTTIFKRSTSSAWYLGAPHRQVVSKAIAELLQTLQELTTDPPYLQVMKNGKTKTTLKTNRLAEKVKLAVFLAKDLLLLGNEVHRAETQAHLAPKLAVFLAKDLLLPGNEVHRAETQAQLHQNSQCFW